MNEKAVLKVMLTIPNFRWADADFRTIWNIHPYGICMIAAMIRDAYDVRILDANIDDMSADVFVRALEEFHPDVVGISMLTTEYAQSAHRAAHLVKSVNPSTIVILGGVYPTTECKTISDANIDYLYVGEGEITFRRFLDSLGNTDHPACAWNGGKNMHGVNIIKAERVDDLDALPMPAYDLVNYSRYTLTSPRESVDGPRAYPYGRIMTSRGCPLSCVFCQVRTIMGRSLRKRSVNNILAEIDMLREQYDIRYLTIDDDNLFLDRQRAMDLFNGMIGRGYKLPWNSIATAVYALDEEVLAVARESGLQYVDLAVESGVERVLREIINKPVNLEHAKKIVKVCKDMNINTAVNFIIGFPGETWDEIRQTLAFAETIDADYCKIFIANPLTGTRLFELAEQGGYIVSERSGTSWFYGRIRTDDFTPEDLAILRAYEWDRINFRSPEKRKKIAEMMRVTPERLEEIRKQTRLKTQELLRNDR